MGELFRRFWLPALLVEEVPEPDCPPVRLRILGEDLVAFRDSTGRVGAVEAHCPHRGASLFFGRNEEAGLRCVYHGWKFDATGACVDMPSEPAESNFKHKVRTTAYPTHEAGGLIWIYMGPSDRTPQFPAFEWTQVPASHRTVSKWIQETNYLQGYEGDIDSSHSSFLHSWLDPSQSAGNFTIDPRLKALDKSPKIVVGETDYGFRYGARRSIGDGKYNWRITQALLPTFSMIPFIKFPAVGRAWIPIDDERTYTFHYTFNPEQPLTDENLANRRNGRAFPPQIIPGTFTPVRNASNDYQIDREIQRTQTFTGIWGVNDQDRGVQESMGPIYDRTREHLGTSDLAIITARRRLIKAARDLQEGIEPYPAVHGDVYHIRPMDVNTDIDDFEGIVGNYAARLLAPV
jgi:phenylpropionate dioxygenase-like ring-hydroxylating dioxygenase large terminal subunit